MDCSKSNITILTQDFEQVFFPIFYKMVVLQITQRGKNVQFKFVWKFHEHILKPIYVCSSFTVGLDAARISAFKYSLTVDTESQILLNDSKNMGDFMSKFDDIGYDGSGMSCMCKKLFLCFPKHTLWGKFTSHSLIVCRWIKSISRRKRSRTHL